MKKSRTGSPAGEALASPPVATVQLPLPLLDVLADTRTAFFGLCLDAGQQVLRTLMEQERARLCGPKNVPNPERRAYRGGSVRGEVTLGGRRILVPRLRARSVDGHELELPSFAYAAQDRPPGKRARPRRALLRASSSCQLLPTACSDRRPALDGRSD